jgi:hypothetical protein
MSASSFRAKEVARREINVTSSMSHGTWETKTIKTKRVSN